MASASGPAPLPPWATAAVRIVPYDPGWPGLAARFTAELVTALGPSLLCPVEHVGSTSVPGLAAKPVIDLMALVADNETTAAAAGPALAALGWRHVPLEADARPWRQFFVRASSDDRHRLAHLHLMSAGAQRWAQQLTFRNALRADAALRDEYAGLKTRLAAEFGPDRERYTAAKAEFIGRILTTLS